METIELKDFVRRSLVQIAQAVREANEDLKQQGAQGAVFSLPFIGKEAAAKGRGIEFDVAVMATKVGTDKSGFGVALISMGGGMGAERSTANEYVQRIRFEISLDTNWK